MPACDKLPLRIIINCLLLLPCLRNLLQQISVGKFKVITKLI